MALKVTPCRGDDRLMRFDCKRFSRFPEKKEVLIFGGRSLLRLEDIRKLNEYSWTKLGKYLVPVEAFFCMMRGRSLMNKQILNEEHSQRYLRLIIADVLRTMVGQQVAFRPPGYIRDWVLFYLNRTAQIPACLLYRELMNLDHGLQSIFKNSKSIDIANIVALFSRSPTITVYITDSDDVNDLEWESIANGLSDVLKFGVSTIVRFQFSTVVDRWKQKEMFDAALLSLPSKRTFVWKRSVHENALTFHRVTKVVDVEEDGKEEEEESITYKVSEMCQKRMQKMIQCLEQQDVHHFQLFGAQEMKRFFLRSQFQKQLSELKWAINVVWITYRQWRQRCGLQNWLNVQVENTRDVKLKRQQSEAAEVHLQICI